MTRTWTVCRQYSPRPDGERRWDLAYQLLARRGGHGSQPGLALGLLETLFDGLITNGKFCCVRRVRLSLTWWHRPLDLRGSVLQGDVALAGEPDEPDMYRQPPVLPEPRRRAPVGSGLPAAGALGRAGRRARLGADRRGSA